MGLGLDWTLETICTMLSTLPGNFLNGYNKSIHFFYVSRWNKNYFIGYIHSVTVSFYINCITAESGEKIRGAWSAFEKHKILTKVQHGFSSGHSYESQLLIAMDDLYKQFNSKVKVQVDMITLDFRKAEIHLNSKSANIPLDEFTQEMRRSPVPYRYRSKTRISTSLLCLAIFCP